MFKKKKETAIAPEVSVEAPLQDEVKIEESSEAGIEQSDDAAGFTEEESEKLGFDTEEFTKGFSEWLAQDENRDDESIKNAVADMEAMFQSLSDSEKWETLYEVLFRSGDYERAVAAARAAGEAEGEVKGRNTSIEELTEMTYATDGLPHPGTNMGLSDGNRAPSIFDLARTAL